MDQNQRAYSKPMMSHALGR